VFNRDVSTVDKVVYENKGMTTLPNLHDGFFDGVWLSADKRARFFVRTLMGERSTIILTDVEALNIRGLGAGNIIFDPDSLTVENIEQAYDLKRGDVEMARQLLGKAKERGLSALEINPSYGAEGTAIFRSAAIEPEHVLA
jgi:hypothetical protein